MLLRRYFIYLFFIFINFAFSQAHSASDIILGMSNAQTGPTAQLGIKLKQGAQGFFSTLNRQGGLYGQQIKIRAYDDGYEPEKTVANTKKLLHEGPLALFGYVGTPTAYAVMPMIEKSRVPFLMPLTGAEFLRQPVKKQVFNLRASYQQEAMRQIEYLVEEQGIKRIGLLIQADEFGITLEKAHQLALKKYNLEAKVITRYRRNTEDIARALAKLRKHKVDAIVFVGTYKPLAKFINQAAAVNFNPYYTSVSFVSSADLFAAIDVKAKLLVTEVVPEPSKCNAPICQRFEEDMRQVGVIAPDRVHLEGYLNAYTFAEVASLCEKELDRDCLLQAFEHFHQDLGEFKINYTQLNHQGLNRVYLNFYPNAI
ncbi:ABC transporter substrate-binding protein [Catenovulum sp. SM1970]|uniref:ABC transporter substrate-binding protein n=1 Tax=Marinifaba aquimaris TaxID=2741323 RepID=UPI0015728D6C|nr:ABC transporter substrate-binding protein [Marinifaba aquimaris]NTS76023.1 ABC transporter substrate-binding protein [Marinifaba aquimaris]